MEPQKRMKTTNDHHHHHHRAQSPTAAAPSTSSYSEIFPGTPLLPEDTIFEILTRLPVKSLLKFKTVCKSWHSLITSQDFINTHLCKSTSNPNFTHHTLLISYFVPHLAFKSISVHSFLRRLPNKDTNIYCPVNDPKESLWLVGSCNGLICLGIDSTDLCIWNPATRKSRKLPDSGYKAGAGVLFGFGYDSIGDDYKVVAMFCRFLRDESNETELRIFSFKTGSWRRIESEGFEIGRPFFSSGRFVNGKLHWAMSKGCDGLGWHIGCIDLGTEGYGVVEHPEESRSEDGAALAVSGGCLCLLCNYRTNRLDVWIMKEYGVKESWSKVVSVPYMYTIGLLGVDVMHSPDHSPFMAFMHSPHLCILTDGRVLIGLGDLFYVYDPADNTSLWRVVLKHENKKLNRRYYRYAENYVESLVFP